MKRKLALVAVLAAMSPIAATAGEFIRIDEDATATRLQTAVTHYEKDNSKVDLIGAVHIADKAYYKNLTQRFATYDELLFEMVGGEKLGKQVPEAAPEKVAPEKTPEKPAPDAGAPADPAAPADAPKKEQNLSGLHKVYDMVARSLDLAGQIDCIDYHAANFVHADLTNAEFTKLQSDRHESLIGFAIKSALKAEKQDPSKQPNSFRLLRAMLAGSANQMKLEIIKTLGHAEDQISALAGESVIISDRNDCCLKVLQRELAAGHEHLGIFYGAAHFPDMEKRLLDLGFKRTSQEWLTAWNIPKEAEEKPVVQPVAPPVPEPAATP